jgi:hypothetical protein
MNFPETSPEALPGAYFSATNLGDQHFQELAAGFKEIRSKLKGARRTGVGEIRLLFVDELL